MNHIYRIIFNRASGVFQVVSELAKGKVKSAKTSVKLTALCMALVSGVALAEDNTNSSPTNEEIKKQYEELKTKVDMLLKVVNVKTVNTNSVDANAADDGGIAIGSGANASNKTATAIGVNATSSNVSAVALGIMLQLLMSLLWHWDIMLNHPMFLLLRLAMRQQHRKKISLLVIEPLQVDKGLW